MSVGVGAACGGGAALRAAASSGDTVACSRLIGPNTRNVRFTRDELGRSALHLAAGAGHAAVVRLLLGVAAPKEADSPDGAGCTALQRAAADGHEDVVRLLIARGADVDRQDAIHGNSALHEASWKGYSRTVSILAASSANLQSSNGGGFTALHLCCQNGHNQTCRELLLAGCDPDVQNNYGDTALHTAARYGHAGVTRILISAQCKVSERNKNGDTSLHIAAAMGRRKLTRILLEAGCDKGVRNKQNETARDIALRKDLNEILAILDESLPRKEKRAKTRKRSKSKVRFLAKNADANEVDGATVKPTTTTATTPPATAKSKNNNNWSPYGCHYYPDPEAFPSPRLDSLPAEPLKRGEQYYLDLAGNIRKGPVGVGYTCYCAPLFRHLEARLEKDKRELQRAQVKLGQRVAGLEQRIISRGAHGRRSERTPQQQTQPVQNVMVRSRSLEMLDQTQRNPLQATRSMDELDPADEQRPSVKELVARIQKQETDASLKNHDSESSDDEDGPLRMAQNRGLMGDSNMALSAMMPNYENVPNDLPRSRCGVYSPTTSGGDDGGGREDARCCYVEPIVKVVQESHYRNSTNKPSTSRSDYRSSSSPQTELTCSPMTMRESVIEQKRAPDTTVANYGNKYHHRPNELYFSQTTLSGGPTPKYGDPTISGNDVSARFAKLRLLEMEKTGRRFENAKTGCSRTLDTEKMFESTTRMLENPREVNDRDTNNDSGYSTKVYGSSKGNSPSLSGGQTEPECLGASSLV